MKKMKRSGKKKVKSLLKKKMHGVVRKLIRQRKTQR